MDLLTLDDYCLEEIFKYFSVQQQIANTAVCSRFKNIMEGMWRRSTIKTTIDCEEFSEKELETYFSLIQNNLEEAVFHSLSVENINSLKKFVFPKVTVLTCNTIHEKGETQSDQVTIMIIKSFPNLTKLCLDSHVTGKFIDSLKNLVELDLSFCVYLNMGYLSKVFSKLKLKKLTILYYGYNSTLQFNRSSLRECTTLEELTMDDHHLALLVGILVKFVNLRKVSCYSRDYSEFAMIKFAEYFKEKIKEIYFNNSFWSKIAIVNSIEQMVNLEKLYLYDDDLEDANMESIARANNKLREFHYIDCKFETKNGILDFVRNCYNLEVLNLYGTKICSIKFIQRLNDIIAAKCPQKPIKVYFGGKSVSKNTFNNIKNLSPLFQYSFEEHIRPKILYKGFLIVMDQKLT